MQPQSYEAIRFESDGTVATITLDRPEKLNAINRQMAREIVDSLDRLGNARALVITGNERAFSAGADLSERAERPGPSPSLRAYDALAAVPIPVIAAIEGYALGGGLEMAMACDLRIAAETAQLGQPEVLRGILPGGGGTQRLPRLVGPGRAKEMMFTGRHISGATAEEWGLVNQTSPPRQALDAARRLASQLATRSGPLVLREIKMLVETGMAMALDEALVLERERASYLHTTDDAAEGIRAFLERRDPEFEGK
jgi:enoyl-CoA hydratase